MKKILSFILSAILILGVASIGINANASTYRVGDIIEFGSYPQSEVKDNSLIAELNKIDKEWISYNYHRQATRPTVGIVTDDYMQYADVEYNGEKYRAVIFSMWRPYKTEKESAPGNTYQDANGFSYDTVYWFKFEPIKWRILNPETGFVVSELVLDSQPFSVMCNMEMVSGIYYNSSELTTYANDYKTSDIVKWLNNSFFNDAFTNNDKTNIFSSISHNSALTEKLFLLSLDEIKNKYGFVSSEKIVGIATGYAKIQGVEISDYKKSNCSWWLRSHNEGDTGHANIILSDGVNYNIKYTNYTSVGVRPAMLINLSSISKTYTLTYDANGGSNAPFPQTGSTVYAVSSVIPVRNGYTFLGWSTSATATVAGYVTGDTINLSEDTVLYAVWQKNVVVVPPIQEDNTPQVLIRKPSITSIDYGDAIILHADIENLPDGASIIWNASNENFEITISADEKTCKIKPKSSGDTIFKVEIVESNGSSLCSDTQEMTSNAGFIQRIIAFFKGLFGLNKTYTE